MTGGGSAGPQGPSSKPCAHGAAGPESQTSCYYRTPLCREKTEAQGGSASKVELGLPDPQPWPARVTSCSSNLLTSQTAGVSEPGSGSSGTRSTWELDGDAPPGPVESPLGRAQPSVVTSPPGTPTLRFADLQRLHFPPWAWARCLPPSPCPVSCWHPIDFLYVCLVSRSPLWQGPRPTLLQGQELGSVPAGGRCHVSAATLD